MSGGRTNSWRIADLYWTFHFLARERLVHAVTNKGPAKRLLLGSLDGGSWITVVPTLLGHRCHLGFEGKVVGLEKRAGRSYLW